MSRTVLDITVNGKLVPEVRSEVLAWMRERKYRIPSEREKSVRGRKGRGWITAPLNFEVLFTQKGFGVVVHIEGYVGILGVSEEDFEMRGDLFASGAKIRGQGELESLLDRLGPFGPSPSRSA